MLKPSDWRTVPLSEVAEIHDNLRMPVNATERASRIQGVPRSNLYPYYGATGQVGWIDGYRMEGLFVLVGEDGAPFLDPFARKAFIVEGRTWVNNHAHILRGRPGILDDRFLMHALNTTDYRAHVNGTTRLKLTQGALRDIPLRVPSVEVQRRIAARIDELFSEIEDGEEELRRARGELETYRNSLLKAAVTGELTADWRATNPPSATGEQLLKRMLADRRAKWDSDPKNKGKRYKEPVSPPRDLPALPPSWTWASLDQLSWHCSYGTSHKCSPDGLGEPVLRIPNLRDGGINLNDLKFALIDLDLEEAAYAAPGDLLIVRTNGSEDLIGRTGIVTDAFERPTHFASYLIRFRVLGSLDRWRWIRAYTESAVFRASVLSSIGSSAGQYNLSMSKLTAFPIALPPDAEAVEALARWTASNERFDEDLSAVSTSLRQSILAAAFRGELAQ